MILTVISLSTYSAEVYNYKVYYPSTCTFMNGKLDTWGHGHTDNYQYQVVCKEGGDISTYVSAPIKRWSTPARVNHIPAPIKGYIYVKEVK
jgi:hypothetical protein